MPPLTVTLIEITKRPSLIREAPEWAVAAWCGLRFYGIYFERSPKAVNAVTKKPVDHLGSVYAVSWIDAKEAFLEAGRVEALAWWGEHLCATDVFLFPVAECAQCTGTKVQANV